MVVISWIISLVFFLTAVSISDGSISKMVIGQLGIAVGWFIIGFIHLKKAGKKITVYSGGAIIETD